MKTPPEEDLVLREASDAELERLNREVTRLRGLLSDLDSPAASRRRLVTLAEEVRELKRRARLSDALTAAVSALQGASEPSAIFREAANALEARGFRSISWAVDLEADEIWVSDIRVAATALDYLERITGKRAVGYRATLSAVDAYQRAVTTRAPVFVDDTAGLLRQIFDPTIRWVASVTVRVTGIRRAIVAPLLQEGEVSALFVVMDNDLEASDCQAVGAFAELMANAAQRADLMARLAGSLEELERAQAQLLHSQKMQAVGLLAGGIAHDFNNLLTAIVGAGDLLGARVSDDPVAMEDVDAIRGAADRAALLVRQLLAFSGARPPSERATPLDAQLRKLEPLLTRTLGEQYRLELDLDAPDPVHIDPSQLDQIVVNLAVNARDAMPDGGAITLRTRRSPAGAPPTATLRVVDEGVGIPEDVRARIFEPFFTTKPKGKGTGLGLSVVYGLVDAAGGSLEVTSDEGRGTTFVVTLPVQRTDATVQGQRAPDAEPPRAPMRLLLVEDDDIVSTILQRSLERGGHTVRRAKTLTEARAALAEAAFQIVVSDVRLGDGLGLELLAPCDEAGVPVIFCSGYLETKAFEERILERGLPFLRKPFTIDELMGLAARVITPA